MKINQTNLIILPRSRKPGHCQYIGGSDARIIISLDEAALIQLWTGDPSRAHVGKSPTVQALLLRPIRDKYSRASRKQRQIAAKLPTLMSGIQRLLKAYAILWQKLYACFSEHTSDQGNRVLVSRVATHLDIGDRVSMQTDRLSQVPNRPIQHSAPFDFVPLSQARCCAVVTRGKVTNIVSMGQNQWGIQ
jgi:hypothetical protein